MTAKDDDVDFNAVFSNVFGQSGFGNGERVDRRHARERQSSKTPKQRQRRAVRTAALNCRVDPEIKTILKQLGREMEKTATDVLHLAVRHYQETRPKGS